VVLPLGSRRGVPDHSTFSKNRHGRFRDSDLLRRLFEATVERCLSEGLVGGEGFAVDGSLIRADANRQRGQTELPSDVSSRAVREYLEVLEDAAFGGASPVAPKVISPTDPAARWTAQHGGPAEFCYQTNYLIDLDHGVIVDVEATTAVRQAEVTAAKRMIERAQDRYGLLPERLAADTGYGSAEMLAWLVHEKGIEPHVPVFDRSARNDGTFSRDEFRYDAMRDIVRCPGGKPMHTSGTPMNGGTTLYYRQQVRLQRLRIEAALLPQGAATPRPALDPRRRPRPCSRPLENGCLAGLGTRAQEG
jgi:hypothetical protein